MLIFTSASKCSLRCEKMISILEFVYQNLEIKAKVQLDSQQTLYIPSHSMEAAALMILFAPILKTKLDQNSKWVH